VTSTSRKVQEEIDMLKNTVSVKYYIVLKDEHVLILCNPIIVDISGGGNYNSFRVMNKIKLDLEGNKMAECEFEIDGLVESILDYNNLNKSDEECGVN
jgi:hypothetical protein